MAGIASWDRMRRDAPGSWAAPTCGPRILNRLPEGGICFENRLLRLLVGSPAARASWLTASISTPEREAWCLDG